MRGISIILLAVLMQLYINTANGQDFIRLKWKSSGRINGVRYEFEKITEQDWVERQNGKIFARHIQVSIDVPLSDTPNVVLRRSDNVYSRLTSVGQYFWGKTMGRIDNLVGVGSWVNDTEDGLEDVDDASLDSSVPPPLAFDADDFRRLKWTSDPTAGVTYDFEKFSPTEWIERQNGRFIAFYTEVSISSLNVEDPTVILQRRNRQRFVRITQSGVLTSGTTRLIIRTAVASGKWIITDDSLAEKSFESYREATIADEDKFFRPVKFTSNPENGITYVFEKIAPKEWIERQNGRFVALYSEHTIDDADIDEPTVVLKKTNNFYIRINRVGTNWRIRSGDKPNNINTIIARGGSWKIIEERSLEFAPLIDSLADLDSDDSTPIAEKAKKVCKKTCENKNLIWSGLFTTKDGKYIETCKCDDQDVVVNGRKYVDVVPKDNSATNRRFPSDFTAALVCPSTCARFGWSWSGIYITFDGFTVHSCRCNRGVVLG